MKNPKNKKELIALGDLAIGLVLVVVGIRLAHTSAALSTLVALVGVGCLLAGFSSFSSVRRMRPSRE